jgi:23S rRNA (cytosine1962-C5)-methyltransferase
MEFSSKVVLKQGREASMMRFHPWVFSGGVHKVNGKTEDGDWVEVVDAKGKTLGFGHFQNGSITVRVLHFSQHAPAGDFYNTKIREAFKLRQHVGVISTSTNCYRLVHGEGDGLPALIIDVYNRVAVVQSHSEGMHRDRNLIAKAILDSVPVDVVFYKPQSGEGAEYLTASILVPHNVLEHENKFLVDWEHGQKTGFFLDQRENRKLLAEYSKGKKVLNTFCYTGGFSVYAIRGGAQLVHSVDASSKAVELSKKNIELNGFDAGHHACITADTFDYFKSTTEKYNLIILDPPAFAKHREARHQAMKGYQRLNAEAMKMIDSGGIIFTFSCSQVVDRKLFYDTVMSAAIQAGREVKVLSHLSQPADHPVSAFHPEGEYLKGLVLYVA